MPAVDHAVINVRDDMDRAVEHFGALGFTLTERGYHSLGSINHLMVFDADYLELVGLPAGAARVRREIAESPLGLNGLVFATDDAARLHDRLAARGVPVEQVVAFDRPVTLDGVEQRASFRTVRLAAGYAHGGRVYFCEHETPHLVWRREWQRHRNGVHGLAEFTLVLPEPAREAARYAEITSVEPRPRGSDEIELAFRACTVRFVTLEKYRARYGGCGADANGRDAFMGALALRTSALARVRECLAAPWEAIEVHDRPDRITVAAASAYNTVLEYVE
jgi:hypothetical protein